MLSVERQTMGIPVIVDVEDGGPSTARAVERAFRWLDFVDRTFSTYREDSEICRLNRGELELCDAHPAVASVLKACERLRVETEGYFDARAPLAGEGIDPSGYVKGWAVQGAGMLLERAGVESWCVNAGGDICVSGSPRGLDGWRIGVQHPIERLKVATVLSLREGAVATSGAYERGDHVLDPHTREPASGLLSVTIVGPDLGFADAYATAAFAMGRRGAEWAAGLAGYGAIAILDEETIVFSAGAERYLVERKPAAAPVVPERRVLFGGPASARELSLAGVNSTSTIGGTR